MKYAIFSDIHGNVHALHAALCDAKAQGADKYIFLGDYAIGFPWGNEVVEVIRGVKSAIVIRGNREDYLTNLHETDRDAYVLEQLKPTYWAMRSLSNENLEYLMALPKKTDIMDNGTAIHISHSLSVFYRSPKIDLFSSANVRRLGEARPFTHEEYLVSAREALLSHAGAMAETHALPKGIYLFGHNHLQFHMEYEGRLFVNPGSCGEALDWDTTSAYTLLEIVGDRRAVTERRVGYDLDAVAEGLHSSGYAAYAPMWSAVMERELMTGKDHFFPFVMHLIDTGRALGRNESPIGNEVWDVAVKTWDVSK